MKRTIYKSASMRSVAIHNLFNRTCVFESIQDKELNKDRDYVFKDSRYEVHLSGKYLNHCTDYPLFGLIIAQWRNNLAGKVEKPEQVTVSLDAVSNLIKIAGNANREAQFKKIKDSLIRLDSQKIKFRYNKKIKDPFIEGHFFKNEPEFSFKNKNITFTLNSFLMELYLPNKDMTYVNFEKLKTMEKEPYMAFFKYLSTHAGVHIDFKLEKLSRILGLLRRGKDEARCRAYIVDKLKALMKLKIIWCYKWNPEKKVYRILQCKHFNKKEAEFALKNMESNLDNWKKR